MLVSRFCFALFLAAPLGPSLPALARDLSMPRYRVVAVNGMDQLAFGRIRLYYTRHCFERFASVLRQRDEGALVKTGILLTHQSEDCAGGDVSGATTIHPRRSDTLVASADFSEVWHCGGYCENAEPQQPSDYYVEGYGTSRRDAENQLNCAGAPVARRSCERIEL